MVLITYAGPFPKPTLAACGPIPVNATVAVVSKGDHALLALAGWRDSHFARTEAGVCARHHIADGAEAIAQLDWSRATGADHLLFQRPAFWEPEYDSSVPVHLDRERAQVCSDRVCAIYRLKSFSQPEARKDLEPTRPSV